MDEILLWRKETPIDVIMANRKFELSFYIHRIDKQKKRKKITDQYYDRISEYADLQTLKSTHDSFVLSYYFKNLPPRLKTMLVDTCLRTTYKNFYYFFHDVDTGFNADKVLIRKIITNLFSSMHFPGEEIYSPGK
jgi:hypothetical protein